jgi:PEP-CTERM motif
MVKLRYLIALGLFCAKASFAQGTMLFTWHGISNYFQATFEITAAESQPGVRWTSDVFLDSMSVSSLSGATYHGGDSSSAGTGAFYDDPPGTWWMTFQLNDNNRQVEMLVSDNTMRERPFSGPDIFFEPGYWTYQVIPEPSTGALLALGLAIFVAKKRRGQQRAAAP